MKLASDDPSAQDCDHSRFPIVEFDIQGCPEDVPYSNVERLITMYATRRV